MKRIFTAMTFAASFSALATTQDISKVYEGVSYTFHMLQQNRSTLSPEVERFVTEFGMQSYRFNWDYQTMYTEITNQITSLQGGATFDPDGMSELVNGLKALLVTNYVRHRSVKSPDAPVDASSDYDLYLALHDAAKTITTMGTAPENFGALTLDERLELGSPTTIYGFLDNLKGHIQDKYADSYVVKYEKGADHDVMAIINGFYQCVNLGQSIVNYVDNMGQSGPASSLLEQGALFPSVSTPQDVLAKLTSTLSDLPAHHRFQKLYADIKVAFDTDMSAASSFVHRCKVMSSNGTQVSDFAQGNSKYIDFKNSLAGAVASITKDKVQDYITARDALLVASASPAATLATAFVNRFLITDALPFAEITDFSDLSTTMTFTKNLFKTRFASQNAEVSASNISFAVSASASASLDLQKRFYEQHQLYVNQDMKSSGSNAKVLVTAYFDGTNYHVDDEAIDGSGATYWSPLVQRGTYTLNGLFENALSNVSSKTLMDIFNDMYL